MKKLLRIMNRQNRRRGEKGSILILVLVIAALMAFMMTFSLRASMNDTQMVYRQLYYVQARAMAEGGLNVAKGDMLTQVAATNFLGGAFEEASDKYAGLNSRFNDPDKRIPSNMAMTNDEWMDPTVQARSLWDFAGDSTLKLLPSSVEDWMVIGDGPASPPRVYITRSVVGSGSLATGAVASYDSTLTAVAIAGENSTLPVPAVISSSYHHQLSYPRLFDYLMLGQTLSDCSFCHLKFWGDIGQVDAANPFQLHSPYDRTTANRLTLNGSLHVNSNFMRNNITSEATASGVSHKNERMLATPGQNGQYIYAKNGGTLATQWASENPGNTNNPFRQIESLATPLPSSWPSVKENLLDWFEPRSVAAAASGASSLAPQMVLDNNISYSGWKRHNGTTGSAIGSGSSVYNRAIDRVVTNSMLSSGNLLYDSGLHPCDDLDGDTIPNGFDADIDNDGVPETKRGSETTSDPAYHLTEGTAASNFLFDPATNKNEWRPGRQFVSGAWSRKASATYQSENRAIMTDANRSWLYSQSGTNFQWVAKVSGIAATMADLIDNNFATTSGKPTGTVSGVWPTYNYLGNGNPDYSANSGKRNLVIVGSTVNPIIATGQVVVRGDVVISGMVDASQAVIVAHRNIFVPSNLTYVDSPDYDNPSDNSGNQLGLVSSANIVVGNFMHRGPTASDHKNMIEFMWGNLISCNQPNVGSGDGFDNVTGGNTKWNHMINTVYLADGQDGGQWVNGEWKTENVGNLVSNVFNAQGMKVGGGLSTSAANYFNSNRKHMNFTGSQNSNSLYKNYYISTPGILPSGAAQMNTVPTNTFGSWSGGWFSSDDLKFFTLQPRDASGNLINNIGSDQRTANYDWINHVESVLYADYAVMGGNIPDNIDAGKFMEFYGTVIGRDVQLLSARMQVRANSEEKYTKAVGSLYYDGRLKGSINPLGFPFEEEFIGGEMSMNGMPAPDGNRDAWVPYRLTQAYVDAHLFD